jgi:hypothetical protein
MTTLAARVLEAIEAAEQLVKVPSEFGWPQEESWHTRRCGADWGNQNCECECPVPAAVLRRCAADRDAGVAPHRLARYRLVLRRGRRAG